MRKAFARGAIWSACLALAACVSIEPPPAQQNLGDRRINQKSYVLGQVSVARIGDDLLKVEDYSVSETALDQVEVTSDFAIDHAAYSHSFHKGETFPLAGGVEFDGKTYNVMKVGHIGIVFGDDGVVYRKIVNNLEHKTRRGVPVIPVAMVYDFEAQPPGPHLKRQISRKITATGKNFELVYAGVTSDSIRITDREFAPDNPSAAGFTQELSYPLASKQIRFRDLTLDVLEAKPDALKFRVISD